MTARRLSTALDALRILSVCGIRLAVRNRLVARQFLAEQLQRYNELMGVGLRPRDPVQFVREQGWAAADGDGAVHIPLALHGGGGTRLDELLLLGMVARLLRPAKVFEFGTFMGRTTSVLALNAPPDAEIVTVDLPADIDPAHYASHYLESDLVLVRRRVVGSILRELRLDGRCLQVACDSLEFDPTPHAGSVELGFIDGAHSRQHVENDTEKMAAMVAERGIVFWHDYGGRGRFRALTEYLDTLSTRIPVYRAPRTTLAWAAAAELRKLA